jgi:ABC-2 type transport system permease protein
MATATTTGTAAEVTSTGTAVRATYLNVTRNELFKLMRQRTTWIIGILLALLLALDTFLGAQFSYTSLHDAFTTLGSKEVLFSLTGAVLNSVRGITGLFVIIIAVRAVALEYQQGTIRVMLSRGAGRLRLFFAKISAAAIIGLVGLVAALALVAVVLSVVILLSEGSLAHFTDLPSSYYTDMLAYIGTLLVNLVATLLFATVIAVLGRNLAFAMTGGVLYFLIENIVLALIGLISSATGNGFWFNLRDYALGQNLTQMATQLNLFTVAQTTSGGGVGRGPGADGPPRFAVEHIDAMHTFVVVGIYALVFAVVSVVVTMRRDVME